MGAERWQPHADTPTRRYADTPTRPTSFPPLTLGTAHATDYPDSLRRSRDAIATVFKLAAHRRRSRCLFPGWQAWPVSRVRPRERVAGLAGYRHRPGIVAGIRIPRVARHLYRRISG